MLVNNHQINLRRKLTEYKSKYLEKNTYLSESDTRILVNHLLSDIIGYREIEEIKTEYKVLGGYIDYLVQVNGKKLFIVEVKALGHILKFKHLKQAIYYAVSTGVTIIILTNGNQLKIFKIVSTSPLKIAQLASIQLDDINITTVKVIELLRRKELIKTNINKESIYVETILESSTLQSHF